MDDELSSSTPAQPIRVDALPPGEQHVMDGALILPSLPLQAARVLDAPSPLRDLSDEALDVLDEVLWGGPVGADVTHVDALRRDGLLVVQDDRAQLSPRCLRLLSDLCSAICGHPFAACGGQGGSRVTTRRIIPAAQLRAWPATIIVALGDRTIRSRAAIVVVEAWPAIAARGRTGTTGRHSMQPTGLTHAGISPAFASSWPLSAGHQVAEIVTPAVEGARPGGQRADHGQPAGREGRRARAGRGQRNVEVEVVVNGADLRPRGVPSAQSRLLGTRATAREKALTGRRSRTHAKTARRLR